MTTATTNPTAPAQENFATLFEESLARQEMRQGELITAEVTRVDYNIVVVNAGLKSESFIPIEEFKNDKGEVEVKAGDFVTVAIESLEDGYGETRLSRDKAKRLKAWHDLEAAMEQGTIVSGRRQRQGQGRSDGHGQRHTRVPAGVAGRHPAGQGHDAVRIQDARIQGHQARPQAQQRRRLAARSARSEPRRRARGIAEDAAGRRDRQGHRQEHHRLRCVRRSGRHRRACCTSPTSPGVGSSIRRKSWPSATRSPPRCSSSTRKRTAFRWA